jgi:hypothetical protein
VKLPGRLAPLGRDDAVSAQLVADVVMIALAIKLRVGQDERDHSGLSGQIDDRT